MKSAILAVAVLATFISPSIAQVESGNDLRDVCQIAARGPKGEGVELAKATYCQGFVKAILFSGPLFETDSRFCAPKGVTVGQAINVLLKYFEENPERTHYSAEVLTIHAFGRAWRCN